MAPQLKPNETVAEIPKRQRRLHRPTLKRLFVRMDSKEARNRAMAGAYLEHAYTLTEIGHEVGLHYATVSRIIKAVEQM